MIRIRFVFLCVFVTLWQISSAQITFQKSYNVGGYGSAGYSVCLSDNNGFAVAGILSINSSAIFLLRLDSNGDTIWCRVYDAIDYDDAISVIHTLDGGYAIAGNTASFPPGGNNIFLLKTDSLGGILWLNKYQTRIKPNYAYDLIQKFDSGFVIAGTYDPTVSGGAFFLEADKTGNLWSSWKYHGNNYRFSSVAATRDQGLIFCGQAGGANLLIAKRNSNGISWEKKYTALPNSIDGFESCVIQTLDGGYLAGCTYIQYSPTVQSDFCLMKIDSLGNPVWVYAYGDTTSNEEITYLSKTTDGGYIAIGSDNVMGLPHNIFAVKVDSLGTFIWSKSYGGQLNEVAHEVHQTSDFGYCIIGETSSFDTSVYSEIYFIKTDELGNSGCFEYAPSTISTTQIVQTLAQPPLDSPVVALAFAENFLVSSALSVSALCFDNAVSLIESLEQLTLFPNPATSQIQILSPEIIHSIEVYNVFGKKICIVPAINRRQLTVDCVLFPKGIYFVQVQTENVSFTKKLIKQ